MSNIHLASGRWPLLFTFCLHLIFHSTGNVAPGQAILIHVSNKCPFTIWPAIAPNTGHPIIADGGFSLFSKQVRRLQVPPSWSGRIWARTGCSNFSTKYNRACQTGDCNRSLACNGTIGIPPVTLVEMSLGSSSSLPDFYDVSLVDGYNLPVSVSSKVYNRNCHIGGCSKNINSLCPLELQVTNRSGSIVACKSACLTYDLDQFCCRNDYGTPEKCKPSAYANIFKEACPSYFSYAYDTPTPLVRCNSKEYVVTFCPSKWGADHDDHMPM